jgi:glycosyltransferase involved in cell wall biosynthesis
MTQATHLVFLTQKYPFEQGEEFIENELMYLARHYSSISIFPTLVRDFSSPRKVPPNVQIVTIKNPQGPLQIGLNMVRSAPFFPSLLLKESRSYKLNPSLLKYLAYHIPFALIIKNELNKIIKGKKRFALYSYWMDTNAYALHLLVTEKPELQFFFRTHGGDLYNERHPNGLIPFRKSIYQSARLIAPISRNGKSYIGKNWPEIIHKVNTHCLGVLNQGTNPIDKFGQIRIVSCSAIIPLKRLDKIIAVLSQLSPNIEWTHFGGKEGDIDRTKRLAEDIMPPNITYNFPGQVSNGELMEFYRTTPCDIFINLSSSEGIPVTIMEAISFGIPVISNDVGGVGEIVNEQTGLLVRVDESVASIAQKINGMLEKGLTKDEAYRSNVRKFWQANYNAEKNYLDFLEEIKSLTNDLH